MIPRLKMMLFLIRVKLIGGLLCFKLRYLDGDCCLCRFFYPFMRRGGLGKLMEEIFKIRGHNSFFLYIVADHFKIIGHNLLFMGDFGSE